MRLTKKVLSHDKTYVGVLRAPNDFDKSALERAIAQMCGQVYNVPPEISAVKYKFAAAEMQTTLLEVDGRDAAIEVTCEAGTYIRTIG